ncbi:MAG: gamma-glutamyl-gamma-aminobutyrate hydrolase family protein [Armatimonadota bacterium]
MRPRIGITTSTLERAPEGAIAVSSATHLAYAHSVYQAGGLPLLIPNLPETDDAEEVLSHLDGLILSGGGDIAPNYWDEAPHEKLGLVDSVRDHFEMELVRAALERNLPMLGICRGLQVMAVATGGALWQDLPSQHPSEITHMQTPRPRAEASHLVSIQRNSLLAQILQPEETDGDTLEIFVNSFHHQAPKNCGRVFTVVAASPDGLIEGLVAPHVRFAVGVQWHPEEMAEADPVQARLFTALVNAAAVRMVAERE